MASTFETCLENYRHIFQPHILQGKVAFITGGGTGIGFTIAEILMRHGCDVAIASRKLEILERSSKQLSQTTGRRCLPLKMDVRKPEDIMAAVDETLKQFGRVDILINNAAGNFLSSAESLSFNAYKTVLEIDTIGTFTCSKIVHQKWMKKNGGVIVNISAVLADTARLLQAHAGSAKAAVDALTKLLGVEWGANKVRVVGVAPGPIADTEGMRRLGRGFDLNDTIPLGCMGSRVDIAHTVLFLCSGAAEFITAETIVVDGGSRFTLPNIPSMMGLMSKI